MAFLGLGLSPSSMASMPKIVACYESVKTQFEKYKQQLSIIGYLEEGDKLGRNDNKEYYIDKGNAWFIQMRRTYYKQGRKETFKHLDEDFTGFMKFLTSMLDAIKTNEDKKYKLLSEESVTLVNSIIPGLYNLKKTYPEEKELICKIDSIILTLIDFKDSVSEIRRAKEGNSRPRSLSDS